MVVGILSALAAIAKVRYSHTAVDSYVFRLHYRWTTTFCFACCILVMAKDHVGGAIECMGGNEKDLQPITTYCWISSTYTINSSATQLKGLGQYIPEYHEKTHHSYYQWVAIVLFMQGCLFYLPHLLWKCFEGKQVDSLLQGLNKSLFDEDSEKKKKNVVSYLRESWGLNMHYAGIYHFCEILNLANVVGQMYAMDKFLGGVFMDYGVKVLSLLGDNEERQDFLLTIFPRLTKCEFRKYGSTGTLEKHDVLCVLPQNIINEKIFVLMWLWFVILTTITAAWVIWRMVIMYSPSLRLRLLGHLSKCQITQKMEQTICSLHLGDFCLLENIGYNLDSMTFKDILQGVTDSVKEYKPSAPMEGGTYKPFYTLDDVDTMPRHRLLGFADTSL